MKTPNRLNRWNNPNKEERNGTAFNQLVATLMEQLLTKQLGGEEHLGIEGVGRGRGVGRPLMNAPIHCERPC